MADIKQGTDEILGRYPTQLLSYPPNTHIDSLDLLYALIRVIPGESGNGTPAKDRFRNQASRI